ncbi:hypothetical protein OO25_15375 [Phaeobacter sp. S60]|nr:hypothetical protein OO25_15375 [Phaeobacter sp. S60]
MQFFRRRFFWRYLGGYFAGQFAHINAEQSRNSGSCVRALLHQSLQPVDGGVAPGYVIFPDILFPLFVPALAHGV